jgi:hypothetical protein
MRVSCIILILATVLTSCKNELKLNAPYKEVPIVYAVIDANEKIHMIRINKAFLGEGDANVMAKVADSVNYKADELTVTLTHSTGVTYYFRDSMVTTESGPFSSTQRVYVNSNPLQTSGYFRLTIKNNHTGNVFTATATPLPVLPISGIKPFTPPYYPVNKATFDPYNDKNSYIDYTAQGTVKYSTLPNAQLYNLALRFWFKDTIETLPVTDSSYVEYNFQNQYRKDQDVNNMITASFKAADIYNALSLGLARASLNKNVYGRKFYKVQYMVYGATQDYLDFVEYSKPSLNINTQKPLYSNFDQKSAYGIFTFRSKVSVAKELFYPYVTTLAEKMCAYQFLRADNKRADCR